MACKKTKHQKSFTKKITAEARGPLAWEKALNAFNKKARKCTSDKSQQKKDADKYYKKYKCPKGCVKAKLALSPYVAYRIPIYKLRHVKIVGHAGWRLTIVCRPPKKGKKRK